MKSLRALMARNHQLLYLLFTAVLLGFLLYIDEGAYRLDLHRLNRAEWGLLLLELACVWTGLLTAHSLLRGTKCRLLLALAPGCMLGVIYTLLLWFLNVVFSGIAVSMMQ